jgi:branched-chain amino acid transport system substrate-binding protein
MLKTRLKSELKITFSLIGALALSLSLISAPSAVSAPAKGIKIGAACDKGGDVARTAKGLQLLCAKVKGKTTWTKPKYPTEIKIGAPLPLTGGGAAFGGPYLAALELAIDAINASGGIKSMGGTKLRLVSADDASTPANDQLLLQQMAADGVSAFVGPLLSAGVISSIPVITRSKVPFLGPQLDNVVTDARSPYVFRLANRATAFGDQAFDWLLPTLKARNITINKVGIIGIDVPPGTSTTDVLDAQAKTAGWQVAERISYNQATTTDFGPIVSRLAAADVDMVLGYQNPVDAINFARAIAQQSWRPKQGFFFVAGGQYLTSFRAAVGATAENWLDLSYAGDLATAKAPVLKKLAADFQAKLDQPLRGLASGGVSVINTLATAIDKAASADPEAIRVALKSLNYKDGKDMPYPFYTMNGGVRFNAKNDNIRWKGTIIQWRGTNQISVEKGRLPVGPLVWPAKDR